MLFLAASPSPCTSLFHKENKIRKCCATVKKYKWIWNVLQERPTFGDFFPVAFLEAKHHFQFPTLTLPRFLHLHLIQQFQWPGHRGHGKPAQARASSPELAAMRGFVDPNTPDPAPWLCLQFNLSVLDRLSSRTSSAFLRVLLQSWPSLWDGCSVRITVPAAF